MEMCRGGWGEANIYRFVVYWEAVLMFIHHFCRGLARRNSCNSSSGNTCSQAIQSMFFLHENLWEPQSNLQLHLTNSSKDAWAAVRSIVTGRSLPSTSFQPQSCGWNATPLNCYTWWQNLRLWQTAASEVRARHLGCTNEVPVVVFMRRISNVATNPAPLQTRLYIN